VPGRTATEQLLISAAADDAAAALRLDLPDERKAFVDTSNFEGIDAKYAISAIKEALLKQGVRLADARAEADTIIEIRSGALSIDQTETMYGIPATDFGAVKSPEAPLFNSRFQQGIAKFAAFAYDAETGEFLASAGPVYGVVGREGNQLFSTFVWEKRDIRTDPGDWR